MIGTKKIPVEPVTLARQQLVNGPRMMELELADTWFAYRFKFKAEEPQKNDDKLPWVATDNDFHGIFKKDHIAGLEKHWLQECKRWKIIISIDGYGYDICIYFKRQAECEAVFDQLNEYFFA